MSSIRTLAALAAAAPASAQAGIPVVGVLSCNATQNASAAANAVRATTASGTLIGEATPDADGRFTMPMTYPSGYTGVVLISTTFAGCSASQRFYAYSRFGYNTVLADFGTSSIADMALIGYRGEHQTSEFGNVRARTNDNVGRLPYNASEGPNNGLVHPGQ